MSLHIVLLACPGLPTIRTRVAARHTMSRDLRALTKGMPHRHRRRGGAPVGGRRVGGDYDARGADSVRGEEAKDAQGHGRELGRRRRGRDEGRKTAQVRRREAQRFKSLWVWVRRFRLFGSFHQALGPCAGIRTSCYVPIGDTSLHLDTMHTEASRNAQFSVCGSNQAIFVQSLI